MAVKDTYDKGPTHGFSARGYSAAYDADRERAEKELRATMAGHPPDAALNDPHLKNPDQELQAPAPMPEGALHQPMSGPGPDLVGNSKGDGTIDPQGQQGGTDGGQPGSPAIAIGDRVAGTPLMEAGERHTRRPDAKGNRPIPPGPLPPDKSGGA